MNDQVAGILGALIPDYGMSPVPTDFFSDESTATIDTGSNINTSSAISPTEFQIQESAIKGVQESQTEITGTANVSSPIRSAKSVGGSSTRPSDTGIGSSKDSGSWIDNPNATTAFQVQHYLEGTAQGMKAISAISNGYVAEGQYNMKASMLEYTARQNERNANNMLSNIREINRAAQNDMSVMSEQNVKRKSEQRIAESASGFAVGKGSYKVLSDNTDWKTNFNASMIALKAGYQGAEDLRQAGALSAQAIINKTDAEIARMNAKNARLNGWISGIAGMTQAGASFTIGTIGAD